MWQVPPLNRQSTIQQLQEHQNDIGRYGSGLTCCCYVPFAIAAVVIAALYEPSSSSCHEDESNYIIDLQIFLYIGAGSQLAILVLSVFCSICLKRI